MLELKTSSSVDEWEILSDVTLESHARAKSHEKSQNEKQRVFFSPQ